MALPDTVRIKISSEAAEYLSITAVVARDMPLRELVEMMLGVTGRDAARVHELLLRGTLVSGASRLRWTGWDAGLADLESLLATFPAPDPSRPFSRERCVRAVLKGPAGVVEIPREAGSRRRLLRKASFWDVLMDFAAAGAPRYLDYSYRDRADCYSAAVAPADAGRFRRSAGMLWYSRLEAQVRGALVDSVEFYVARENCG